MLLIFTLLTLVARWEWNSSYFLLLSCYPYVEGSRQQLERLGKQAYIEKIKNEKKLLLTDTTMRDAHQSLVATRLRTYDFLQAAPATEAYMKDLFSLEMWGGATFDVAYRFLNESPWRRLNIVKQLT